VSARAWTRVGYACAGVVVLGILARAFLRADLVGRAGSASTMQELSDVTHTYLWYSGILLFFVGCAALIALVSLLKVWTRRTDPAAWGPAARGSAAVVAVVVAGAIWRVWHVSSSADLAANVLVAGSAVPSRGDVAALVAAAGRPIPHTGAFGVIAVCLLAACYVLSLRRASSVD
jgi:hypothetical protein